MSAEQIEKIANDAESPAKRERQGSEVPGKYRIEQLSGVAPVGGQGYEVFNLLDQSNPLCFREGNALDAIKVN